MVSKNIQYLLSYFDCVIIPGFGGILSNYKSAEISLPEFSIYPPGKNLAFNRMLQTNDGLLAQQIAFSENIPYKEAEKKIKSFVKDIDKQLLKSGTYNIESIGRWYMDENEQLQFSPVTADVNAAKYVGMPVLSLQPVARLKSNIGASTAPVGKETSAAFTVKSLEALVDTYDRQEDDNLTPAVHNNGWAYWAAAAAAVLFVMGSFWINNATKNQLTPLAKGSLFLQSTTKSNPKTTTNKSTTIKPTTTPKPKPVEFKKEEPESTTPESITTPTPPSKTQPTAPPTSASQTPTTVKPTKTPNTPSETVGTKPTPKPSSTPAVKAKTGKLFIVAGSFGSEKNAQLLQQDLAQKGYSGKVMKNPDNGMFRVVIETSKENREADLKKAKQDIAPSVWVLED